MVFQKLFVRVRAAPAVCVAPFLAGTLLSCEPARSPLECIAPAAPGGGWDLTCRSLAAAWGRASPGGPPMRVVNVPGASGGIGFARAAVERATDANVIVAASPATTLRLAQGQFGSLGTDDVRWVAAIAADYGVVAVRARAPWRNMMEFVESWRQEPESIITAGGSSVGGQDHMKMLLLARAAGIDGNRVRYVPFDGGGEAMTTLLGGFVDAVSADATEALGQFEDGQVRVLAALAPTRLGGAYREVPTARELGFPVDWLVWRGFYVPKNAPRGAYEAWQRRLERVEASEAWREIRDRRGLSPMSLFGPAFEAYVRDQVGVFHEMSRGVGLLP